MPERLRILVVDDERDTLDLIDLTLSSAGYEIHLANNGAESLEKIRQDRFDVILLDIMMPDMTGFDVLRTLNQERNELPPVIFLTAKSLPEDREMGLQLGAKDFLIKPVTRGTLLDSIKRNSSST
jgi:two-component system alkaline phosphatase synthesis response regulator PhoP